MCINDWNWCFTCGSLIEGVNVRQVLLYISMGYLQYLGHRAEIGKMQQRLTKIYQLLHRGKANLDCPPEKTVNKRRDENGLESYYERRGRR